MAQETRRLFNCRLSEAEMNYLDEASYCLGLSKSAVVRTLLRSFIRKTRKHGPQDIHAEAYLQQN